MGDESREKKMAKKFTKYAEFFFLVKHLKNL